MLLCTKATCVRACMCRVFVLLPPNAYCRSMRCHSIICIRYAAASSETHTSGFMSHHWKRKEARSVETYTYICIYKYISLPPTTEPKITLSCTSCTLHLLRKRRHFKICSTVTMKGNACTSLHTTTLYSREEDALTNVSTRVVT